MFVTRYSPVAALDVANGDHVSALAENYEVVRSVTPLSIKQMSKDNLRMLKKVPVEQPDWLASLPARQRTDAQQLIENAVIAHTAFNERMEAVSAEQEFAAPLLRKAIKDKVGLDVDVNKVRVNLSVSQLGGNRNLSSVTLLEAALHNFPETDMRVYFLFPNCFAVNSDGTVMDIKLDVNIFVGLCRQLDLGKKYQAHIREALNWDEPHAREHLNDLFVIYQKSALKAASYVALCKKDIEQKHYDALAAIVEGDKNVRIDGKPVWYRSLSFTGMPVHSCTMFEIADPDDEGVWDALLPTVDGYAKNDFIAYIPDDPDHPVKHYKTLTELKTRLIEQFLRRAESDLAKAPSAYQQFFSRFMRHKDRAKFYYSFTEEAPTPSGAVPLYGHRIRQQKEETDFLLQFRVLDPSGDEWAQHYDLWTTLRREFDERIFQDAADAIVSTEDADGRDAHSLLETLLDVGLVALNLLSFAVPPLGVVMLSISAVQLMYELLEGFEALSKGDKEAGWEHITDLLENIGVSVATLPLFVGLHTEFTAIEVAAGQKRLWKPDLAPYRSHVSLEGLQPDGLGQYRVDGKHYIRLDDAVFEKVVDPLSGQSRIAHPSNPKAYQPFLEQDEAGQWHHSLTRSPAPDASRPVGFGNDAFRRYAIKPSDIGDLTPSGKGISRSPDGRFFIRNVDARGKVAVYGIRSDFLINSDIVDVVIVDPDTNRAQGPRLIQVAADQWQPLSLGGGSRPEADVEGEVTGDTVRGDFGRGITDEILATATPSLTRERLPNGLWEPVIATGVQRGAEGIPLDWGPRHDVPFIAERTQINNALSVSEFSRIPINTDLFSPVRIPYSKAVGTQLANRQGGASFVFEMQRVKYSAAVKGEFNAIKIVDIGAGEIPDQSNAVSGFWAPQGGYVDIPANPGWGEPDHVFTPGFGGCSLVVDQLEENLLRVRHVEGGKEDAQYNKLATHEHGWGQSAAMEYRDYGIVADQNSNLDTLLGGFAFMKYDRKRGVWNIHYQAILGTPTIFRYSTTRPGLFGQSASRATVFERVMVRKSMSISVVTARSSGRLTSTKA